MKTERKTHTVTWTLKRDPDGAKHFSPNKFTQKRAEALARYANTHFEQATHVAERIKE